MASTTEASPPLLLGLDEPEQPPSAPPAPHGEKVRALDLHARLPELAQLYASPSIPAFVGRRVDQMFHGHTPRSDLEIAPYALARKALDRLQATSERLMGHPDAERLQMAQRSCEIAGAMIMALHERIAAELRARQANGEAR